MKLQLDDVALFSRIAELGTLSAAARERDVPVSQITLSLSRLESACGAGAGFSSRLAGLPMRSRNRRDW